MQLKVLSIVRSVLVICVLHIPLVASDSNSNDIIQMETAAETSPPAYSAVPSGLSFTCKGRLPGYYADVQTRCQVWHWCVDPGRMFSFLCPHATVFNQAFRVCDWWFNVNCSLSEDLYSNNSELYI